MALGGGARRGGPLAARAAARALALRARDPAGGAAAGAAAGAVRARRLPGHRRAGARAPGADRDDAGAPAGGLAAGRAGRDPHGDGGAAAAALAAVPAAQTGAASAAATTRSSGWWRRPSAREAARKILGELGDIERLASRARLGVATPRDLVALGRTLGRLPALGAGAARRRGEELPVTAAGRGSAGAGQRPGRRRRGPGGGHAGRRRAGGHQGGRLRPRRASPPSWTSCAALAAGRARSHRWRSRRASASAPASPR